MLLLLYFYFLKSGIYGCMIIKQNGWRFGTWVFKHYRYISWICRGVPFMFDCLSSVWGHSVHFEKFPMLRFSKRCMHIPPTIVIGFQPKFVESIWQSRGNTFLGNLPNIKNLMAVWNFSWHIQGHVGWKFEMLLLTSTVFHWFQLKLYVWGYWLPWRSEYSLLLVLAIGQVLQKTMELWNFNMGVNEILWWSPGLGSIQIGIGIELELNQNGWNWNWKFSRDQNWNWNWNWLFGRAELPIPFSIPPIHTSYHVLLHDSLMQDWMFTAVF